MIQPTESTQPKPHPPEPWVFCKDSDSHWYLIPRSFTSEFEVWQEHLEADLQAAIVEVDYPEWTGTNFDQFICECPTQYLLMTEPVLIPN